MKQSVQTAGPDLIDKLIQGGDSSLSAFTSRIKRLRQGHSSQTLSRRESIQTNTSGSKQNIQFKQRNVFSAHRAFQSQRHLIQSVALQPPKEKSKGTVPKMMTNKSDQSRKNLSFLASQTNQQNQKSPQEPEIRVLENSCNTTQKVSKRKMRPHHKSFLCTTALPASLKKFNSGVQPALPMMSPAMKSDRADNRSIRILSLIDG